MTSIKTAISIQKDLFDQADSLAHKLNVSRSRIFVLALEEYIKQYQNQSLLDDINKAYSDEHDQLAQTIPTKMRKHHRKIIEGEW